jgi:putative transposase
VRKRGGRERALGKLVEMAIPQEPNQRWYLHFVSDAMACSQRFRMLNVIDDSSRECPGMHRRYLAVRSAGCSRAGRHR